MRFLLLTALLFTAACPAPKQAAGADENDPLVRKLRAERARLSQAPPGLREALANAAVADDAPVVLPVPATGPIHFKGVLISLKVLERSHTVKNQVISVSTLGSFLKLTLVAEAIKEQTFDLSGTTLIQGGDVYPIDATAQRVGQGSSLEPTIGPAPRNLVLFFEVPEHALIAGLKLVVRSPDSTAELALQ